MDFLLWKPSKPGEPSWDSPWGAGRPGWHIECSAMSMALLGEELDIHGGGADLIFPHHENEIAQSEAATGHAPFVRYWMHVGWLTVERRKMSKSLGNFSTVREVLLHYPPQVLRFLFVSTHYRQQLEFSDQALDQARSALERLEIGREHLQRMVARTDSGEQGDGPLQELDDAADAARHAFVEAMNDDFNTPRATAALFDLVAEAHRLADERFVPTRSQRPSFGNTLATLNQLAGILGLTLERGPAGTEDLASKLTGILINIRQRARTAGDYALADSIRAQLAALGIALEDRPDGTTWRRA
jgi:cysteinyl-tRNA synthetase